MTTWEDNADEFAALDKGEGWPFAALVACSVERGAGTGTNQHVARATPSGKTSAREFATRAGTSADRVLRYLDAWELAATTGEVPPSCDLAPSDAHGIVAPTTAFARHYAPVRGGRNTTAAAVRTVIEKPKDVARHLSPTERAEVRDALAEVEREERELATMTRGGRTPSVEEINARGASPLDGVVARNNAWRKVDRLVGELFELLAEFPPATSEEHEQIRAWAVRLVDAAMVNS